MPGSIVWRARGSHEVILTAGLLSPLRTASIKIGGLWLPVPDVALGWSGLRALDSGARGCRSVLDFGQPYNTLMPEHPMP